MRVYILNLQWIFLFAVSGVELSNPSGEGEKRLEEDSGPGILSCETLRIGEDFWYLTHWKGKSKIKTQQGRQNLEGRINK